MSGGERRAYLDRSPGEVRAVVTLDGQPERLLIAWEGDPTPRLAARYAARVDTVSERLGLARLELGGEAAALRFKGGALRPAVGERMEVEVAAEPHGGKPALVRRLGPTDAPPGLLRAAPLLEEVLAGLGLAAPIEGERAREAADLAQEAALAFQTVLAGGLTLSVQPTRALVAVDLDLAEEGEGRAGLRANLRGLREAARLLRLKSLGGLVCIDLIGFPREAAAVQEAARQAFAPDGPEVSLAPLSRFGLLQVAKPNARQPLAERLLDRDGQPTPRAEAHAVLRALERQGRFEPGARMLARCAPAAAALAQAYVGRLGPRFRVAADLGCAPGRHDIVTS